MNEISLKIGVHTQALTTNYGGILQNYALQTILKNIGHEVWTLDVLKYTWLDWGVDVLKMLIKKILGRDSRFPMTPYRRCRLETPLRRFVYKNITLTIPRVKDVDWSIAKKYNFDAIIVGSDQVWRPIYNSHIENLFLRYVEDNNVKKIAYAASFGTDHWEYTETQTKLCSALAKEFHAISVREKSGVDLCARFLGIEATQVLDPTLLLSFVDYNNVCAHIEKQAPFVFAYILDLDERKINEIKTFAQIKGLPYYIKSAGSNIEDTDSIERWLSYFRDAAFVITDSFHGTAFSIIYRKDFFVYGNESRGNSRFESLLTLFHLNHRIVRHMDSNCGPIDWTLVKKIHDNERERSIKWLEKSLC